MNRPVRPGGHNQTQSRAASTMPKPRLAEMLRVDHAGEYAAVAIYDAQHKIFARSSKTRALAKDMARMRDEEKQHLATFDALLLDNEMRPTAIIGLWKLASTALGAGTALLGPKAAHACTEAVESVIAEHYAEQISETKDIDAELCATFSKFREDELRHHDHAIEEGAHKAPAYPFLTGFIKAGCRTAIKISEKI